MTDRDVARSLTLRYIVASTAILAASGLLGVLLRWSQSVPDARFGDNFWYAMMTAHGLGAFVGWAAFAVMGLAWWIFYSVGFPTRGFGLVMARTSWWLMVLGVAGVVVTTLIMQFAASWVFLYPLPFESAGEWGNWATGLFSFSVLLAGLSIVTWCFGVLHTAVNREALHAVKTSIFNRLGLSMGWGYLFPKTFATNPKPVPYPVIPLAVIGIDMIIATLPLAGLLVWQIFQSMGVVGEADSLFAKNILWWFGHPVVYLLLFPAVAAYYFLIPRYAGRQLVAGNVIAIAWTVAVIANVTVWAHHIYLDYPDDSVQDADQHGHAADHVLARAAVGAVALQPRVHDLPLALPLDGCVDRALPRAGRVAPRRSLGDRQRDHRLRRDHPQHAVDRRALPPHGDAQHRPADLRRGVRAPARAERQGAVQRADGVDPRLDDVHGRDDLLRHLARPGPRRRAAAVLGAPQRVRRSHPLVAAVRVRPRRGAGALLLERLPDAARPGRPRDLRRARSPAAVGEARVVGPGRRGDARPGRARPRRRVRARGVPRRAGDRRLRARP